MDERIALLDDLMAINTYVKLEDVEVANLLEFLCALDTEQREAILVYINKGERFNRFERFAKLASKSAEERSTYLKALGLTKVAKPFSFTELFSEAQEKGKQAGEAAGILADFKEQLEGSFIGPFRRLFSFGKAKPK